MSSATPRSPAARRAVRRCLCAAAGLLVLTGCGGGGPVQVSAPSPGKAGARVCRALHAALPGTVDGEKRRAASPKSPYTAAWGDPAIVLRCGVRTPAVLRPDSGHYNPQADSAVVDGVDWLFEKQPDGGYRYTTLDRAVEVQVTVPKRGGKGSTAMVDPLLDFASAVKRTVRSTG